MSKKQTLKGKDIFFLKVTRLAIVSSCLIMCKSKKKIRNESIFIFHDFKKICEKINIPPSRTKNKQKRARSDKEERPSLDMLNNELSVYWIALESFI